MMKIKGICTDIDGTLLNKERQLSEKTIGVFRQLAVRMPIILASSRMPSAMYHLQRELGIERHPLICYNGGYTLYYSQTRYEPMNSVMIDIAIVSGIISTADSLGVHTSLYHEDNWFAPRHDYWTDREERITKANASILASSEVVRRWERDRIGAHKVMCMGEEPGIEELQRALTQVYGSDLHLYRSRPTYLEIAPKTISKGIALQMVTERKGISIGEIIAFGDNYNDIDMLKVSGRGVAVGNARQEVLAVAGEVTGLSIDDGVANYLEKYCF